jgi:hypothetical protein
MTFITHGFRVSVVSDVRERVRDFRITFALYVVFFFLITDFIALIAVNNLLVIQLLPSIPSC